MDPTNTVSGVREFAHTHDSYDNPDSPPVRPASALSGSGSSFVSSSDEDDYDMSYAESSAYLSRRAQAAIARRDGKKCLLCEEQHDVNVLRIMGDYSVSQDEARINWLKAVGVILDCDRNDSDNLITLCEDHTLAYLCSAWRFSPCSEDLETLTAMPVKPVIDTDENVPGSELKLLRCFDMVIFQPESMPPVHPIEAEQEPGAPTDNPQPTTERILRLRLSIPINPFHVFVSLLEMCGTCYWPPPDDDLRRLEKCVLSIRTTWNQTRAEPDVAIDS